MHKPCLWQDTSEVRLTTTLCSLSNKREEEMYILVTYDVETVSEMGNKRLRQVARICKNYGQRVQNSVFECEVSEAQYCILKNELRSAMDEKLDSIRFYHLNKNKNHSIEMMGKITSFDINDAIIL